MAEVRYRLQNKCFAGTPAKRKGHGFTRKCAWRSNEPGSTFFDAASQCCCAGTFKEIMNKCFHHFSFSFCVLRRENDTFLNPLQLSSFTTTSYSFYNTSLPLWCSQNCQLKTHFNSRTITFFFFPFFKFWHQRGRGHLKNRNMVNSKSWNCRLKNKCQIFLFVDSFSFQLLSIMPSFLVLSSDLF